MREVFVIGIGAGDPDHLTVQAIKAMNLVDVFFVLDKGAAKDELVQLRRQICAEHIVGDDYRFVEAPDPARDRTPDDYRGAVLDWHELRASLYGQMIRDELGEDGCGAFLVWGDPSLYDSTLRILDMVATSGAVAFECTVVPGITSVQALAAGHAMVLNRIGEPIHITTGRRLRAGLPDGVENAVVMLDAECSFESVAEGDAGDAWDIYWGAYLGTADETLIAGPVREVQGEIERVRGEMRERKGWIMDTYLLRRER
ncbi:precorrin-6A synthase (deacetylating) [Speluncibacter jeojiensis]|uniref:Precorrin-6A synthase (Deacetylating) n=1 Tax=Speluncibacter jeojiensis TaxID=2710754 RepID=A0A9X4LYY9_9ACTN|nr:precorrin-6A synthase (deacetylating) [Corynebacteriales bacterium D3-21]